MGKITRAIRNLPIRLTFMLYVAVFMLLATVASALTINTASTLKTDLYWLYSNQYAGDDYKEYETDEGADIAFYFPEDGSLNLFSVRDRTLYRVYDAVEVAAIPVWFGACLIAASLLFYRNKLKTPIALLDNAAKQIAGNDLDFQLTYPRRDEMGRLCDSFEKMRYTLEANNRELWRAMEERRRLIAAFSHDLRTPLTVLKGYTDMLAKYLPEDKLSKEKLVETVTTMSGHVARLEHYVEAMNRLQKLEDIFTDASVHNRGKFVQTMRQTAAILTPQKELLFEDACEREELCLDAQIVSQVYENLLVNAARYAKHTVCVLCRDDGGVFTVQVSDDGEGFSARDFKHAIDPFYKSEANAGGTHLGLGLHISKLLCERHGGTLRLSNQPGGGAAVQAIFSMYR